MIERVTSSDGLTWTVQKNDREAWAICSSGSVWVSRSKLEVYALPYVPLEVMEKLWSMRPPQRRSTTAEPS